MSNPERRTLPEQLGSAFNASRLEVGESRQQTPLTMVAALGAAALQIQHGADRRGVHVSEVLANPKHEPNPQDVVAAELAQDLAHVRFGRQYDRLPRTILLFAHWMSYRGRFAELSDRDAILLKFANRVMHEWLSDRCPKCAGTGRLELTPNGVLVRGRGLGQRNAVFRSCPHKNGCGGTGKPTPSHTARRKALGIDAMRYDKEGWGKTFTAAFTWLERDLGRLTRPLTAQLERCKKRD